MLPDADHTGEALGLAGVDVHHIRMGVRAAQDRGMAHSRDGFEIVHEARGAGKERRVLEPLQPLPYPFRLHQKHSDRSVGWVKARSCAPCPPLPAERVGTARAGKLALTV
jgi:hypothetical protein